MADCFRHEREAVAYFMRRLYRQGLTTTSGGNLSCRAGEAYIALTPSGIDKGEMSADQVALLGFDGVSLTPELKPSIEAAMHLAIYRRHPRVRAVVHAHPPAATLFSACEEPVNTRLTAEAYAILGEPVLAPYRCMGTEALAEEAARAVGQGVCVLLQNHGVLTVGESLLQAFDRLEVLDVAARQTLLARLPLHLRQLDSEQCRELDRLMGRAGVTPV